MTLPDERYRAVIWAKKFLEELAFDKTYKRVPREVRDTARSILRHYPFESELERAAEKAPDIFQQKMEPLYRMVYKYDMEQNEQESKPGTD
jgi:hypothetical protein